jgi:hypothetical protein
MKIVQMPCKFRAREGDSRLIGNIWSYAKRAGVTIIQTYVYYKPLKTFFVIGFFLMLLGLLLGLVELTQLVTTGFASFHPLTAIVSAVLIVFGFQVVMMGLIADSVNANRRTVERVLYLMKKKWMR